MSVHSFRAPTVTAARKRGVIRIDLNLVENSRVVRLTDTEWRAYFSLLPWVARYCENADGEFPREWLESFSFGFTPTGRPRRITEKLLARLVASGLVELCEYDDGSWTVAIVGWRDFRPVDMTSAERKRRFRRRLYGPLYYGTEGDVAEVRLESAEEVAAIEAEDARLWRSLSVAGSPRCWLRWGTWRRAGQADRCDSSSISPPLAGFAALLRLLSDDGDGIPSSGRERLREGLG